MLTSKAIQVIQNYIIESEMEGYVDKDDPWYPTYLALSDLKEKVLDEEEIVTAKQTSSDVPDYEWQVRHEIVSYDSAFPTYDCDNFDWFSTFKKAVAHTPDDCDCGCDRLIIALHCFIDDSKAYVVSGRFNPEFMMLPTGRKIPKQYQDQLDKETNNG